jgi:transcription antitermination factor NusG
MPSLDPIKNAPLGPSMHWYALHTRCRHERMVATALLNKGFHVFLPSYESLHRWADRYKRVTLPLFPGYLFLADGIDRRIQILSTPGVHSILKVGDTPAAIPNDEIAAIRRMVESSLRVGPHPFLKEGDRVRIKSGPLVGLEGIVSRMKDALRLVVTVQLLGRSAAVEIDECMIERIGSSSPMAAKCYGPNQVNSTYSASHQRFENSGPETHVSRTWSTTGVR